MISYKYANSMTPTYIQERKSQRTHLKKKTILSQYGILCVVTCKLITVDWLRSNVQPKSVYYKFLYRNKSVYFFFTLNARSYHDYLKYPVLNMFAIYSSSFAFFIHTFAIYIVVSRDVIFLFLRSGVTLGYYIGCLNSSYAPYLLSPLHEWR